MFPYMDLCVRAPLFVMLCATACLLFYIVCMCICRGLRVLVCLSLWVYMICVFVAAACVFMYVHTWPLCPPLGQQGYLSVSAWVPPPYVHTPVCIDGLTMGRCV